MQAQFQNPQLGKIHNERLRDTVQFIPIKSAEEEFLETEISEDRLLVIDQEDAEPEHLEIVFKVSPVASRIAGISLNIANCSKCELFAGECFEYKSIQKGIKQDDMPELDVYKYEFNFSRNLTSIISLKFKTTGQEVLIFGIDVFVCPPAAGDGAAGSIDLHKVEEMLAESSLGISDAAERCKEFLKTSLNRPPPLETPSTSSFPDRNTQLAFTLFDQKLTDMEHRLMEQIEKRFTTLEQRQEERFLAIMDRLSKLSPD